MPRFHVRQHSFMDSHAPSQSTPILLRLLRVALLTYIGLVMLLGVLQGHLVYFPRRLNPPDALQIAQQIHLVPLKDPAGELIGWRLPNPKAKATLLVFHGNAGHALDREYYLQIFSFLPSGKDWEIILFEYPGYGPRSGSPGETAFKTASLAAYNQLKKESPRPIYLLGESLGSGVACALACSAKDVAGLLLVTPFTSLPDVAAFHYPVFPVRTLLRDRFDNVAALEKYRGPLAVLLAENDEVVTAKLGQKLFDSYHGPKQLWKIPKATHNSAAIDATPRDWEAISRFLLPR